MELVTRLPFYQRGGGRADRNGELRSAGGAGDDQGARTSARTRRRTDLDHSVEQVGGQQMLKQQANLILDASLAYEMMTFGTEDQKEAARALSKSVSRATSEIELAGRTTADRSLAARGGATG